VRAGAAIVHLHAYDAASGRQRDDADIYETIISGIRTEGWVRRAADAFVAAGVSLATAAEVRQALQKRCAAVQGTLP
jgi:uncharacterized protein (DUF849 family)